jgi:hypothetical protein
MECRVADRSAALESSGIAGERWSTDQGPGRTRSLRRAVAAAAAAILGAGGLTLACGAIVALPAGAAPLADTGYWMAASDGGVFNFGSAGFYGSMGASHLNSPIVGLAPTSDQGGSWEVGADGGVFAFGDASFYGSMGGKYLNSPIVGMTATPYESVKPPVSPNPAGKGYWMVASDGGVFTFGDAAYYGSMGGKHLNSPIVGMTATPSGTGYWLAAADGGVFSFGDAVFYGSMGGKHLNSPIVGMTVTALGYEDVLSQEPTEGEQEDGEGYSLMATDGGVFALGDTGFFGSMGASHLNSPVVGAATVGVTVAP